jgi:hypothetical protein
MCHYMFTRFATCGDIVLNQARSEECPDGIERRKCAGVALSLEDNKDPEECCRICRRLGDTQDVNELGQNKEIGTEICSIESWETLMEDVRKMNLDVEISKKDHSNTGRYGLKGEDDRVKHMGWCGSW